MEEDVHMILEGTIAELIVKCDSKLYRKYIWKNKNDKPMLYVKLKRLFMGYYKWLYCSGGYCRIKWGFKLDKLNIYGKFVPNKTINGWQCTIIWHVDDLKISHVKTLLHNSTTNLERKVCLPLHVVKY